MEWIERLNKAINCIEENLDGDISYEELGQVACCSSYHFQRMFSYMAGMPLSEYIRRRKMSRAAVDLQSGDEKIIDIAAKYGYDSPTAFNRAFQSVHGFAPSQAKAEGQSLKSFPPISFKMSIKGVEQMEYRIEKKDAFRIVGISQPLPNKFEESVKVVPAMWGKAAQEGVIEKLCEKMNGKPKGVLGVSFCNSNLDSWKYFIAVSSTAEAGDFEEYTIPACTWAIFSGQGTGVSIQQLEERIITEWLPTSGYEYSDGPDVEVYIDPNPADTKYEVWIPVIKK